VLLRSPGRAPARAARLAPVLLLALLAACGQGDWLTGPRRAVVVPPAHTPILFVHGWNANSTTWTTMISRFKGDGWTDAELANFSYNTSQSNATTASLIATKVDSILAVTGAAQVDIVTHSMGALSARYYVKNLGGGPKVESWITLGGPDHGTTSAYFCPQTSCVQMRPGSSFLSALNATDETPGAPRYATWWSNCDEVVYPHTSVSLSGAANTQTACLKHSQLHEDATVYAQVRDWLKPPTLASAAGQ
jgi:triacylglycerol lipase